MQLDNNTIDSEGYSIRHKCDLFRDAGFVVSLHDGKGCILHDKDVSNTFYECDLEPKTIRVHSNSRWDRTLSNNTRPDGSINPSFRHRFKCVILRYGVNYKAENTSLECDNLMEVAVLRYDDKDYTYMMIRLHSCTNMYEWKPKSEGVELMDSMPIEPNKMVLVDLEGDSVASRHTVKKMKLC